MVNEQPESISLDATHRPPPGPRSPSISNDLNHDEIRAVLSRYELGAVHRVEDLRAGSELSPKAIVECERGKMLLKRRARGLDVPSLVAFSHEVLIGCLRAGLCVPPLVGTTESNNSMVQFNDHIYELFVFIEGGAYSQSAQQAHQAGALLGEAHEVMGTLEYSFEASVEPTVVDPSRAARVSACEGFDEGSIERATKILAYGADLVRANAERAGLVHGDWHPGNMIYQGDEVVAVCDFDNTRIGSRQREIAQALVHFSLRPGAHIEPETDLIRAFFRGYHQRHEGIDPRVIASLMPAVLLDEAFASVPPGQGSAHAAMLTALLARAVWMQDHHGELTTLLDG